MSAYQNVINGFRLKPFSSTIVLPASGAAVAAGDALSAETTNDHFTFGATGAPGDFICQPGHPQGVIVGALLTSSAAQSTKLDGELWLFSQDIAEIANNDAFTITDAEILTLIGVIDFASGDWKVGNGNAMCAGSRGGSFEFAMPFVSDNGKQIFGQLVARNAYTFANAESLACKLMVIQN